MIPAEAIAVGPGYVREWYGEPVTVEDICGDQCSSKEIVINAPIEATQVYLSTLGVEKRHESGTGPFPSHRVAIQPLLASRHNETAPIPAPWLRSAIAISFAALIVCAWILWSEL